MIHRRYRAMKCLSRELIERDLIEAVCPFVVDVPCRVITINIEPDEDQGVSDPEKTEIMCTPRLQGRNPPKVDS